MPLCTGRTLHVHVLDEDDTSFWIAKHNSFTTNGIRGIGGGIGISSGGIAFTAAAQEEDETA